LIALVAVVVGVVLYRRASKAERTYNGPSDRPLSPRTAAGAAHYRSRVVVSSSSTATNPPVSGLDAADDLEAGGTAGAALSKTTSQTSVSSASSVDSWARNNNVDLFDDIQPV
jgi:hypothetical protein